VYLALQDFHDNWSQGLSSISGNIKGLAAILSNASPAYVTADSNVCQAGGGS
jgi:hypothetical protein